MHVIIQRCFTEVRIWGPYMSRTSLQALRGNVKSRQQKCQKYGPKPTQRYVTMPWRPSCKRGRGHMHQLRIPWTFRLRGLDQTVFRPLHEERHTRGGELYQVRIARDAILSSTKQPNPYLESPACPICLLIASSTDYDPAIGANSMLCHLNNMYRPGRARR